MTDKPVPPSEPSGGGTRLPINRKALVSVIFGVSGFLMLFMFPFGAFAFGVPAITTSIHARREIATSHGAEGGDGLATYGLLFGGVGLFFGIIALGLDALP